VAQVSGSQPAESVEQNPPTDELVSPEVPLEPAALRSLPLQCPGCGAFAQTNDDTIAGYYNAGRKVVKDYIRPPKNRGLDAQAQAENDVVRELLKTMSPKEIEGLGLGRGLIAEEAPQGSLPL
jgi:hypothetical protein